MITANITSYIGQDLEAEHYYCEYEEIPDSFPSKTFNGSSFGDKELKLSLTESQAKNLNKKDGHHIYKVGTKTNRFDSIKQIHDELKKVFENQIIVTYYENRIFKEMLYLKDGVNLGYKAFGEVWNSCPNQCWSDLIPKDVKVKCECGKEYTLDQVSYERTSNDNYNDGKERTITIFYKKREFEDETGEDLCCKYFYLMWNVIL
jgi:hypothetical protein